MTEHTIAALCQRSRDISLEKGWLNPDGTDPRPLYTVIGLFHTELSEAFEDVRAHEPLRDIRYEVKFHLEERLPSGAQGVEGASGCICTSQALEDLRMRGANIESAKPCGIPIELADYAIRVCQYIGSAGFTAALVTAVDTFGEVESPDDVEKLIADLHACVSRAYTGDNLVRHLGESLVRLFAFCEKQGIDLWKAIDEKEAFNRTRPARHGGKKH